MTLVPAVATIQIYTQYLDFTGKFVMHCHVLDQEDLGMMENYRTVAFANISFSTRRTADSSSGRGTHSRLL
jgi:hypothetical protein